MNKFIKDEKERLEIELKKTTITLKEVQEKIQLLRKKGEELVAHYNYVLGAKDLLIDIENLETEEKQDGK